MAPAGDRLAQLAAKTSALKRRNAWANQEKCAGLAAIVMPTRALTPALDLTIMVTLFTEERDHPSYDLGQVRHLAALQKVVYANRSVERDAMNLGYEREDVCRCLQKLTSGDFRHSGRYDRSAWYDVYRIRFTSPAGFVDDLYIKLSLGPGCLLIDLFSFHLTRTI